ncbi:ABC transporter ATP-binding protein [Verminephrobacter eiseniae]|uniref:ABC transporter related n=1 Tax=Verminephrobacter eiseniae (strain EF01-2) TaxID=391735 RepID=A1WI11_VEREI|nr:ABC transporter ATP-binding protein [Verminephrobacter eiseniae]ABM57268.1 ABC transporter related [Verminephrobacter eiseniae EF01-2]MCW5282898.1 ABC transporter ATP-binding protein [Verminephrobacter eiseniae]MCW5303214.1 ABC transporter ATP-binding protein [Verminephrobacter eiseniae]MCW8178965.1 ABC transporter ATP-binding protein [Verminephrobacter eiseniae]MCW8189350.1 ABC transporter ATP-binding protein [Verminephrobacter eiseniae]
MFLELSRLEVRHAGHAQAAVQALTLALRAGDIGVLIGPSGCGKTSLLRAVAGLTPVSGGEIRLSGSLVGSAALSVPPELRRIGMVFQDYALFPHLSVGRNVAFGIHRLPRAEQAARVAEVLRLVGLDGCENRFAHELSGGQQQRVALARALAPRPRLMLLDEPFSSLDVDLRERLAHEVRGILKAAGTTALLVTHDQFEAFALGDVIGVMHEGQLHQWADAYTLYHRPATRFVADFIGHGVLAPATLVQRGGHVVAQTPLGDLVAQTPLGDLVAQTPLGDSVAQTPTPLDERSAQTSPGACDVLLRADDIVHDDRAPLQAQIMRKSFRGAEFLYTLRLASGQHLLAHVPSHHDHALGEWIGIRAQVDHVVTFPRAP